MVPSMKIDAAGLFKLKEFEGYKSAAYWDENGWAIGYGHHGVNVTQFSTCTLTVAENWLANDTDILSDKLSQVINANLNQNQFNALVIFTYNVGLYAFDNSTLLDRLNSGNFADVPNQIARWVRSNGKVNPALEARRQAEIEIWNTPCEAQDTTTETNQQTA